MSDNMSTVAGLEPALVWEIFAGMSDVPRPSKHEERICEHMKSFAESKGLKVRTFPCGNLVIEAPATSGRESAPITVLQAHVDMVCEKNSGTKHDFLNDPIRLVIGDDHGEKTLRADGTTLGADNGMGVAMAMAAALSPDVKRGPLEILLTINEEAGMTGALSLTPNDFKGRRLINLDSEEETAIYIGCAGGCDTNLAWRFPLESVSGGQWRRVSISGLRGGHSGCDIHESRGSAVKLLTRVLRGANVDGLRIAEIAAGSMRNAIPRESTAMVLIPDAAVKALDAAAPRIESAGKAESPEAGLSIRVESASAPETSNAMSASDTSRLLMALSALPQGVTEMSPAVPGLVRTSNNISTIRSEIDGDALRVEIGALSRSSSNSAVEALLDQIASVGRLSGADVTNDNAYPGWEPNLNSPLLETARRVYERLFNEPPNVAAIHAGLECGIIGERVGGMDMISIGPRIEGAHSPDERVYVDTVARAWKYFVAILDQISTP
jgi:dipeptidase D